MSDVHRHYPEASPAEAEMIQLGALLRARAPGPVQQRDCRNCGDRFSITERLAARPQSKWTSLCPSCLADEI